MHGDKTAKFNCSNFKLCFFKVSCSTVTVLIETDGDYFCISSKKLLIRPHIFTRKTPFEKKKRRVISLLMLFDYSIMALDACGEVAPDTKKRGLGRYSYAMKRAVPVRFAKRFV